MEVTKFAIDVGFRHIDCAHLYQNEEQVGQAIRSKIADGTVKREDIFYTSKVLCVLCECAYVCNVIVHRWQLYNRTSSCLVNCAYWYNFFHTYLYIKSGIQKENESDDGILIIAVFKF